MEREHGNKLIAEFMGRKYNPDAIYLYHDRWEELMPVVEKIEKKYHTILHDKRFQISNADIIFEQRGNTKIEAVWNCVVELLSTLVVVQVSDTTAAEQSDNS